jgi:two-component system sensor histidine kinase ChvG
MPRGDGNGEPATDRRATAPRAAGSSPASRVGKRGRLSPLTRKILAVNLLALAIPVVGMLYLGPYRERLIEQELQSLKEQGEIIAGALGEGAIGILADGQQILNIVPARGMVRRLSEAGDVRARFFLADGSLAVDSQRLGGAEQDVFVEELDDPTDTETLDPIVNPVLSWIDRLSNWIDTRDYERYRDFRDPSVTDYPEAAVALRGTAAASVRRGDDDRLVLSVALPVQRFYQVFGSLMLSRDGARVEQAMRDVRLTVVMVFAGALVVTVLVSLYFAGTIARPLRRLSEAAERVRHTGGRDPETIPDLGRRGDEIGDLSIVLREMTAALTNRITAIERFAADVSHEIKNPLTSLKSAIETVHRVKDPDHQRELLRIVKEDVERLDRLITDISDASRLDAELERDETTNVDLAGMLETLVDMHRAADGENAQAPVLSLFRVDDGPHVVSGREDRLVQVFRNLIGNARSFSPPGGRVELAIRRDGPWVVATCEDEGPGIPPGKLDAIFNRFYTERPEHEKFGAHSGLGLSISKQIVEAHEGAIHAENRLRAGRTAGARFVVRLRAASGEAAG